MKGFCSGRPNCGHWLQHGLNGEQDGTYSQAAAGQGQGRDIIICSMALEEWGAQQEAQLQWMCHPYMHEQYHVTGGIANGNGMAKHAGSTQVVQGKRVPGRAGETGARISTFSNGHWRLHRTEGVTGLIKRCGCHSRPLACPGQPPERLVLGLEPQVLGSRALATWSRTSSNPHRCLMRMKCE